VGFVFNYMMSNLSLIISWCETCN